MRVTDSVQVKEFIKTATDFIRLIDERDKYAAVPFYLALYQNLAYLIYSSVRLPEIIDAPRYDGYCSNDSMKEIYESLSFKFKKRNNHYWEVFDSYHDLTKHEEPVIGDLSDDLCDIYEKIAPGLRDWPGSNAALRRAIVWCWKFDYTSYWGVHATGALRALHALLTWHIKIKDRLYAGQVFI